jgi:TP901 family phage tail tape measure protein
MGKQLKSEIGLFAYVDNSFNTMANRLTSFGNQVMSVGSKLSWISVPLIAAGKQVLSTYKDYDSAKLLVQSLEDYSDSAMKKFDDVARQYGKTTQFTATQTMETMGTLTQAGLDYEQTMDTLPSVLRMATAGDLELAEASDLLLSNLYATGTAFEKSMDYVDLLAISANKTNSDIGSLSEGVQRMGATTRMFSGGNREVLTWLGVMGNLGYQAGEAGTYLRNAMLALAAPTSKAKETMEAMGASEKDLAEALEDVEAVNAAETMRNIGLQMYDSAGKMRPIVAVFGDLKRITSQMTEKEANEVMSALFPKRTLGAAGGIMNELEYAQKLYEDLGNAQGAAARMADTRTSGVEGNVKRLGSAVEELKLVVGDAARDEFMEFTEDLRQFVLSLADSDPEIIRGWVNALATLAVAGPSLLIAGKGISLIGGLIAAASTTGGALAMGAIGIGMLMKATSDYERQLRKNDIKNHFGELALDAVVMEKNIANMTKGFEDNNKELNRHKDAVEDAAERYKKASSTLSQLTLDASLFGYKLTTGDKAAIIQAGEEMYQTTMDGISAARTRDIEWMERILPAGDPQKEYFKDLFSSYYDELAKELQAANDELADYLVIAISDGNITVDEQAIIDKYIMHRNSIAAKIQQQEDMQEYYQALGNVQMLGKDYFDELFTHASNAIDNITKTEEDNYRTAMGKLIAEGKVTDADAERLWQATQAAISEQTREIDLYSARGAVTMFGQYDDAFAVLNTLSNAIAKGDLSEGMLALPDAEGFTPYDRANYDAQGNAIITAAMRDNLDDMATAMKEVLSPEKLTAMIQDYQKAGEAVPVELQKLYQYYHALDVLGYSMFTTDEVGKGLRDEQGSLFDFAIAQEAANENPISVPAFVDQPSLYESAVAAGQDAAIAVKTAFGMPILTAYVQTVATQSSLPGTMFNRKGYYGKGFADGGRATEPSIFGEAGAEWAIPEEHTPRTADLLASAARASGFTFGELIARTGGLNANPTHVSTPVVYSPTIHLHGGTADAEELSESMMRKFQQWYREQQREQERTAYV